MIEHACLPFMAFAFIKIIIVNVACMRYVFIFTSYHSNFLLLSILNVAFIERPQYIQVQPTQERLDRCNYIFSLSKI